MVKSTSENAPKKTITKANRKPDRRKRRSTRPGCVVPAAASAGSGLQPWAMILIGFMGAGKSSVGRIMAGELGWDFEDLDQRIERQEERTVAEIFRDSGETEFRRLEMEALKEVLSGGAAGSGQILALGGGAFVQPQNASLIAAAGIPTIFLDAPVEELWQRCRKQSAQQETERPLLGELESFRDLYQSRRPHYMKAAFRQETGGKSVELIAAEVIQAFGLKPSRQKRSTTKGSKTRSKQRSK